MSYYGGWSQQGGWSAGMAPGHGPYGGQQHPQQQQQQQRYQAGPAYGYHSAYGYPQQQQQQHYYAQQQQQQRAPFRPPPPAGMLNSSAAQPDPRLSEPRWREYVDSLKNWQTYYAQSKTAPSAEHAAEFEKHRDLLDAVSRLERPAAAAAPAGPPAKGANIGPATATAPVQGGSASQDAGAADTAGAAGAAQGSSGTVGWPKAFRDYVERELGAVSGTKYSGAMKAEMEALVHKVGSGMWDVDWLREPSRVAAVKAKVDRPPDAAAGPVKRRVRGWEAAEPKPEPVATKLSPKRARGSKEGGGGGWGNPATGGWGKPAPGANEGARGAKEGARHGNAGADGWGNPATGGWGKSSSSSAAGDHDGRRGKKAGKKNKASRQAAWSQSPSPGSSPSPSPKWGGRWGLGASGVAASDEVKLKRAERFAAAMDEHHKGPAARHDPYAAARQEARVKSALKHAHARGEELDLSQFTVQGTSTALEKKYLRLTGVPDPGLVRPQAVLEKSLQMVVERWAKASEAAQGRSANEEEEQQRQKKLAAEYHWVCDQLKAVRQDLKVQHISNDFTVRVYETHARIALQQLDVGEFNQCLTQLLELYAQGLCRDNEAEFAGYHVLYMLFVRYKYGQGNSELAAQLAAMPERLRASRNVRHALAVRSALERAHYVNFYKLCQAAPGLGDRLLSPMLDFCRHEALKTAFATYKTVRLDAVATDLMHLDVQASPADAALLRAWINDNEDVVMAGPDVVDMEKSRPKQPFAGKFEWPVLGGDSVRRATELD